MITVIQEIFWAGKDPKPGDVPGYGDVTQALSVVSVPKEKVLKFSDGRVVTLPEPANAVALSEGGKFAWQGHESGMVYEGLTAVHKGFGNHSFLYVGETLHILKAPEDEAVFQATSGGWRYVQGSTLVPFGDGYTGVNTPTVKKPWQRIEFPSGVMIGQGPGDFDGIVATLPGEAVFKQLVPGNANDVRARQYGETFVILGVFYKEGVTRAYRVLRSDLEALPTLPTTTPVQPPSEPPVTPPIEEPEIPNLLDVVERVRAKYPTPLGDKHWMFLVDVAQQTKTELFKKDSGDHILIPGLEVYVSQDIIGRGVLGDVWVDILSDAETTAKARWSPTRGAQGTYVDVSRVVLAGAPPVLPPPVEAPPPTYADEGISKEELEAAVKDAVAPLVAEIHALETKEAALEAELAKDDGDAQHGDVVEVTGKVSVADILSNKPLTWTGKIK